MAQKRHAAPSTHEIQRVVALFQIRNYQEAETAALSLTRQYPLDGFGWKALSTILFEQARWPEAVAAGEQAAPLLAQDAEFHNNFANSLRNLGKTEDAEKHYARAIALKPEYVEAYDNLGILLQDQGRLQEAEQALRKAIALRPQYGPAHEHLANLLAISCRIEESVESYRNALALNKTSAKLYNNFGSLLQGAGRHAEAEASFRQALTIDPSYAHAYNSLGHLMAAHGFHTDAEACFRGSLKFKPEYAVAYSNLLFSMAHREEVTPEEFFAEHRAYSARFEQPLRAAWPQYVNSRDPERPLRIGIVSGDLHDHALIRYLGPVLQHLADYPEFILYAYSTDMIMDAVTEKLKTHFHKWRQASFLSDPELAEEILRDEIDIVLDLSGHTGYNRLLALVRKPAPIQIGWMGYVGTSGLDCMDYFVADRYFAPPSFADQFSEKLMYLPATTPFKPFDPLPPVNALPALTAPQFMFGSFHRLSKLNRHVIGVWSQILRAVPESRLLLSAMPDATPPGHLARWFAEENIAPERLIFQKARGVEEALFLHYEIDLALDAFPYSGSTTSNHSLTMGVPTLTLAGATVPGRMGTSLASHTGLDDFIAHDKADFVEKAVYWATHREALAELRPTLRQRFADSTLQNPELITAVLVQSLRAAWRRWCSGLPPEMLNLWEASSSEPLGKS